MYLTVPTNWDEKLLTVFAEINESKKTKYKIGQVYGGTLTDFGDGRTETGSLPDIQTRKYIEKVHQLGLPFNFVINAPSMCGKEHDIGHRKQILETIKWIEALGGDIVTVANPFLGELVPMCCIGGNHESDFPFCD